MPEIPNPDNECSIEGCAKPAFRRGICSMHNSRMQRYGDVTAVHKPGLARTLGTCSAEGCDRESIARDLCGKHYQRLLKYGDALTVKKDPDRTVEERFWPRVNKNGPVPEQRPEIGPCWVWTGTKLSSGYGIISIDGRTHRTHRLAFEWLVGEIPEGLEIDHLCRNRACCRPTHLEPVTGAVNIRRGVSPWGVNSRKTECPQGHPYSTENTYITPAGGRVCRICARERTREWLARKQSKKTS